MKEKINVCSLFFLMQLFLCLYLYPRWWMWLSILGISFNSQVIQKSLHLPWLMPPLLSFQDTTSPNRWELLRRGNRKSREDEINADILFPLFLPFRMWFPLWRERTFLSVIIKQLAAIMPWFMRGREKFVVEGESGKTFPFFFLLISREWKTMNERDQEMEEKKETPEWNQKPNYIFLPSLINTTQESLVQTLISILFLTLSHYLLCFALVSLIIILRDRRPSLSVVSRVVFRQFPFFKTNSTLRGAIILNKSKKE